MNLLVVAPLPAGTSTSTLLSKILGSISKMNHKLAQPNLLNTHPFLQINRLLIAPPFRTVLAAFSPNRLPHIHAFSATHLGIFISILGLMQLFIPH